MKKIYAGILLFFCLPLFSQEINNNAGFLMKKFPPGPALNHADSVYLMNLPEKVFPSCLRDETLPPVVDNSELPYLRPVFEQQGPSCGQAAMICYNFKYEMNCKRDLSGNVPENQYPSHFTWNFQNGGDGWYGVSYFHSAEILRTCGNMNVADYGDYYDDGKRWINGYDVYYHGMSNRVKEIYSIHTGTEEGILALKHWLYNHMGEQAHGGVASFYACSPWSIDVLNDTTPEGGKYIYTMEYYYPFAGHAMTIVGYNDSIRWDYNDDGLYTNHIDLNNDGIIDPRDWEIGGVKFVNSYNNDWGDSGFCYMTYKCLAEDFELGGIWNKAVQILEVNEDYQPLLTYKITLKHDIRNKIRVLAGVSQDTSDLLPAYIMDFPILDHQGGLHYLQGNDTAEALKSLEFGLDVTPLLSQLQPGLPARFFFLVDENDRYGEATGEISAFSLMDYVDDLQEIQAPDLPLEIENDSRTMTSLVHTPDFEPVQITTERLPVFNAGEPYSIQLEAGNGSLPYTWELVHHYCLSQSVENLPDTGSVQVLFTPDYDTIMPVALPFGFSFYGEEYDTVWMHINGYLLLGYTQLPWPYLEEPELMFRNFRMIAPVDYDWFTIIPAKGDGGWVELNDSCATFRWQLSYGTSVNPAKENFAARIWQNGKIEFIYGSCGLDGIRWISGISSGNNCDFLKSPVSGADQVISGTRISFTPGPGPQGMTLDGSGLLTGTPVNDEKIDELTFRVTDDRGLSDLKTFQFTSGPYIDFLVSAGGDDVIEAGDTVWVSIEIENGGEAAMTNTSIELATGDPLIEILDPSCIAGNILPGQTVLIPDAFRFFVSIDIPDQHDLGFMMEIISSEKKYNLELHLNSNAPVLKLLGFEIESEDGILDPGETAPLSVILQNFGHASLEGVISTLVSTGEEIQVIGNPSIDFGTIGKGMTVTGTFTLHAGDVPEGLIVPLVLNSVSSTGLQMTDTVPVRIGKTPVLVIDGDPNHHSAPMLFEKLGELDVISSMTDLITPDIKNYRSVFICLGFINSNHVLSWNEGTILADYLEKGGNIYMEGRKTWRDDPDTPVHPKFSLNPVYSVGTYDTLAGIDGTFTQGIQLLNEAAVPFSYYYLEPVVPAINILRDKISGKSCAVAFDEGSYKTIGALFEYGTMADLTPYATLILLEKYLEFFGIPFNPVGVEEHGGVEAWGQGGLELWPNPAGGELTVDSWQSAVGGRQSLVDSRQLSVVSLQSDLRLEILDVFGVSLLRFEEVQSLPYQVDISALKPGIYIVRLSDDSGSISTGKFFKICD